MCNGPCTPSNDFPRGVFATRAPLSTCCEVIYPNTSARWGMVPGVTSDFLMSRAGSSTGRKGVVVRRCERES
jgi:hypothetical protein